MLVKKIRINSLAVIWLLIISVLFFLPGSSLPKVDLFGIPHFDKYVHAGFFALLCFLWRFYFPVALVYSGLLLLAALIYGFGVEVVQHYFIAYRSFDIGDVAADVAGAIAGILFWGWYKKNRPL